MQAVKQQVRIPANRELRIQLPAEALAETNAEVIVLFQASSVPAADELAELQEAMNDPLFVADLREVMDDFRHAEFDAKTL
jgi:hypothetical protein